MNDSGFKQNEFLDKWLLGSKDNLTEVDDNLSEVKSLREDIQTPSNNENTLVCRFHSSLVPRADTNQTEFSRKKYIEIDMSALDLSKPSLHNLKAEQKNMNKDLESNSNVSTPSPERCDIFEDDEKGQTSRKFQMPRCHNIEVEAPPKVFRKALQNRVFTKQRIPKPKINQDCSPAQKNVVVARKICEKLNKAIRDRKGDSNIKNLLSSIESYKNSYMSNVVDRAMAAIKRESSAKLPSQVGKQVQSRNLLRSKNPSVDFMQKQNLSISPMKRSDRNRLLSSLQIFENANPPSVLQPSKTLGEDYAIERLQKVSKSPYKVYKSAYSAYIKGKKNVHKRVLSHSNSTKNVAPKEELCIGKKQEAPVKKKEKVLLKRKRFSQNRIRLPLKSEMRIQITKNSPVNVYENRSNINKSRVSNSDSLTTIDNKFTNQEITETLRQRKSSLGKASSVLTRRAYCVSNLPFIQNTSIGKPDESVDKPQDASGKLKNNFMPLRPKKAYLHNKSAAGQMSQRVIATGTYFKRETKCSPSHYRIAFDSDAGKKKLNSDLNQIRKTEFHNMEFKNIAVTKKSKEAISITSKLFSTVFNKSRKHTVKNLRKKKYVEL
ncbi:unnamed protein product [Moneuplotes crassus]|uniref:Uncharacterized protein n=1 Tax=Euplotes crassus TaxID=5936 RepID=A0AAD2DAV6_EUPCR|nr:unnamed protein product [Moneuplotes crassus]